MSNAILKFALRRFFPKLAGRALGRSLIEIISAPVFALWNFYLCRSIMKQARIRTLGPLLIQDVVDAFWPQGIERANDEDIQFTFSALKETVILCGYFHFNHILLAQEIIPAMEATHLRHLSLNDILRTLPEKKQFHYLKFIALLLVMDGKWSKSKEELLSQLRHRAGLKCPLPNLRQYDQMVCEGEAIVL